MKRLLTFITAFLVMVSFSFPAQAEMRDMKAYVYKWEGGMNADGTQILTRLTSGVRFWVQAVGADTLETLYEFQDLSTSLTNPVSSANFASSTVCNDMVQFSVDPTDAVNDAAVDVYVVLTDGGFTAFVEDFDRNTHTIVVDARPGIKHHGMYRTPVLVYGASSDTEVDFAYDTIVHAVTAEIITTDGTDNVTGTSNVSNTVDIGTADDPNGFVDGISLTTAGFVDNTITTVGELLDDGTTTDIVGHKIDGTDEQTLHFAIDSGASTGVVMIHYWFTRVR